MPFTLELPSDIGSRLEVTQVSFEGNKYRVALRKLANENPNIHDFLINSKNELRQTIRCSMNGRILEEDSVIPDGAQVQLFFIRAGG